MTRGVDSKSRFLTIVFSFIMYQSPEQRISCKTSRSILITFTLNTFMTDCANDKKSSLYLRDTICEFMPDTNVFFLFKHKCGPTKKRFKLRTNVLTRNIKELVFKHF